MDSIQQLSRIKMLLHDMDSINDRLLNSKNELSALDIALLKQQCVSLYELIITLTLPVHDNRAVVLPDLEISSPPEEKIEEVLQAPIIEEEILLAENNPAQEHLALIEDKAETQPEPSLFNPEPVQEKKSEPEIVRSNISLHEKMANMKQPDIRARLSDAKVDSLKAAINLNKKIAFVNDLFKENTVEYAKAIDKLNSASDLNEALRYFNELKHHYSWNNDNELVNDLEQLIQKRFR
jgi:hypothetical protein